MTKLKPCPWCGGPAKFYREGLTTTPGFETAGYKYRIVCGECGARNGSKGFTILAHFDPLLELGVSADTTERDNAIKEWNQRAGEEAQA